MPGPPAVAAEKRRFSPPIEQQRRLVESFLGPLANGAPAMIGRRDDASTNTLLFEFEGDRIAELVSVVNPDKLTFAQKQFWSAATESPLWMAAAPAAAGEGRSTRCGIARAVERREQGVAYVPGLICHPCSRPHGEVL